MRLNIISTSSILGLAATTLADRLIVSQYCYLGCTYPATFITDYGRYDVSAAEGCRGTPVPGMTEFCIDWRNARGHFRYSHQGNKRCLKEVRSDMESCGIASCSTIYFDEVPCTWREAGVDEGVDEVEGPVVPSSVSAI